ncbi:MAG: hypothetical protein Q4C49_11220 [Bacillota bacterium]|nr:hypothetical protein [Bacillota bacterium]
MKNYKTPKAYKVEFNYKEQLVASDKPLEHTKQTTFTCEGITKSDIQCYLSTPNKNTGWACPWSLRPTSDLSNSEDADLFAGDVTIVRENTFEE